jgi:hypothetical protein
MRAAARRGQPEGPAPGYSQATARLQHSLSCSQEPPALRCHNHVPATGDMMLCPVLLYNNHNNHKNKNSAVHRTSAVTNSSTQYTSVLIIHVCPDHTRVTHSTLTS